VTAQRAIAEAGFDDRRYQEMRANAYGLLAHLLAAAPTAPTLERLLGITSTDSEASKDGRDGSGSLAPAWRALRDAAISADPDQLARANTTSYSSALDTVR